MAGTGSSWMVKGINSAIAIGELSPGNAPTTTPINTPAAINPIFSGVDKSNAPWMNASIIYSLSKIF